MWRPPCGARLLFAHTHTHQGSFPLGRTLHLRRLKVYSCVVRRHTPSYPYRLALLRPVSAETSNLPKRTSERSSASRRVFPRSDPFEETPKPLEWNDSSEGRAQSRLRQLPSEPEAAMVRSACQCTCTCNGPSGLRRLPSHDAPPSSRLPPRPEHIAPPPSVASSAAVIRTRASEGGTRRRRGALGPTGMSESRQVEQASRQECRQVPHHRRQATL